MQRIMRLKLNVRPEDLPALLWTMEAYTEAFTISARWDYLNSSNNKLDNHKNTYRLIREQIPDLPSSLVQGARDCACEALKGFKERGEEAIPKRSPHSALRYNERVASVFLESGYATLATVSGRVRVSFAIPDYFHRFDGWKTKSSKLVYDRGSKSFYLCVTVETDKVPEPTPGTGVLGIDRGINNIAVTSANQFFNSKAINNVRGRYSYLRKQLRSKGTRSAKRKLIELSGRERRFEADVNHQIAKEIVDSPYGAFVLEDLSGIRKNQNNQRGGKRSSGANRKLGSWAFLQLEHFIRYKAEELGKTMLLVDPSYTSQRCSRCGDIRPQNRHGTNFHCHACNFELHADLNASRNIAQLGISELSRFTVNKPNVALHELQAHNLGREQLQASPPEVG